MADDALSAGAVARRLGVAVTTLRTWHQRYGLGPSQHEPGQHRRYTAQDLRRLETMLRLTGQGVAPAEAAAWARRTPATTNPPAPSSATTPLPAPSPSTTHLPSPSSATGYPPASSSATTHPPEPSSATGYSPEPSSTTGQPPGSSSATGQPPGSSSATARPPVPGGFRAGGGRIIALGVVLPAARGLSRAAMRLDAPAMRHLLEVVVAEGGVTAAWADVIVPVLIGIGERYQATKRYIEVEHLLSRCVTEVLAAVPRPLGKTPRVLLAAADEEQHTLPLEALAAALAEAGVGARLLGARLPPAALADAVTRTGPVAVVLWSQTPVTGDPSQLSRLVTHPHPPLLVGAAGPGWPDDLPAGVARLTGLAEARELLVTAVS